MWRPFVAAGFLWVLHFGNLRLKGVQALPKHGRLPLLPENFLIEAFDGFVLQGRKRFKLDNSFFHAPEGSRLFRIGESFNRLLR
ncbi:MAG: hypothetical protein U9P12_07105 [Verrucomicrobiota bacterium]|nr:hypothetical protein [Verrucomicrobiota bacterium]